MTVRRKPSKKLNDITLTNMRAFWRSVPWPEWWEEFYRTVGSDGLPLYKSVEKYAAVKAKCKLQREFMRFMLGPKIENDPDLEKYPFVRPQDWLDKREMGVNRSIGELAKQFRKKENALEALREAGNSVTIKAFYSLDFLNEKLDSAFQHELFAPGRPEAENWARAAKYLSLKRELLGMIGLGQDLVAKSLGINYDNMEGYGALIAASAISHNANTAATNKLSSVLDELHTMVLLKKKSFPDAIDLPLEIENKLLEAGGRKPGKPQ